MGGNIFDNTSPIKREYIEPTINQFTLRLNEIFPNVKFEFELLGSTGKKAVSNDIDLALNENIIFKDNCKVQYANWGIDQYQLMLIYRKIRERSRTATVKQSKIRAMLKFISGKLNDNGLATSDKNSGSGSLFCCFPQYDENGETGSTVQIDVNFGNLDWLLFSYHAEAYPGNIKGLHRTQLLVSLFSYKGRTFRHGSGIFNLETNKYEACTPNEAVELLNKLYGLEFSQNILNNFLEIYAFINQHLSMIDLYGVYDIYLKILDSTRCDIPYMLQDYWMNNKDRLDLKGNFLPENSKLHERLSGRK